MARPCAPSCIAPKSPLKVPAVPQHPPFDLNAVPVNRNDNYPSRTLSRVLGLSSRN